MLPELSAYVSTGQNVHAVALALEYLPGAHGTGGADAFAQDDPAGHAVHKAEPGTSAYDPTSHEVHAVAPVVLENEPAGHITHKSSSVSRIYPREQLHAVASALGSEPSAQVLFELSPTQTILGGHAVQVGGMSGSLPVICMYFNLYAESLFLALRT